MIDRFFIVINCINIAIGVNFQSNGDLNPPNCVFFLEAYLAINYDLILENERHS